MEAVGNIGYCDSLGSIMIQFSAVELLVLGRVGLAVERDVKVFGHI
jgi:hypothetical protein